VLPREAPEEGPPEKEAPEEGPPEKQEKDLRRSRRRTSGEARSLEDESGFIF
jgi:hypothetical protein